jgi:membrane dipeptidase
MHFNGYTLDSYVDGNDLHINHINAMKGAFCGGLYAIFPPPLPGSWNPENVKTTENGFKLDPAPYLDKAYAKEVTDLIIENVYKISEISNEKFCVVKSYNELIQCKKNGQSAAIIHFEGAEAINTDLSNLEYYYSKGLRSLGLVWSRENDFANGVPFLFPSTGNIGDGLTNAGKKLVKACNDMGIILDLAHLNLKGFYDVAEISTKPLVVSHTGAHKLSNLSRNLIDEQIQTVKKSEGLVGIYFAGEMLSNSKTLGGEHKLNLIVKHIDYIAENFGIDYVALGSDFDGCTLPADLKDCSEVQKIFTELQKLGYKSSELEKIAFKNWFRVIKDTFLG